MLEPAIDIGGPLGRMVLRVLGMVFIRDHSAMIAAPLAERA